MASATVGYWLLTWMRKVGVYLLLGVQVLPDPCNSNRNSCGSAVPNEPACWLQQVFIRCTCLHRWGPEVCVCFIICRLLTNYVGCGAQCSHDARYVYSVAV
jgi:hypothetical protein